MSCLRENGVTISEKDQGTIVIPPEVFICSSKSLSSASYYYNKNLQAQSREAKKLKRNTVSYSVQSLSRHQKYFLREAHKYKTDIGNSTKNKQFINENKNIYEINDISYLSLTE